MNQSPTRTTPLGVIEGFFGRDWGWKMRRHYAEFLRQHHYDFYIYAPKSDKHLRTNWTQNWPHEQLSNLRQLRQNYRDAKVQFGIGLSPHEIYLNPSRHQRQQLNQRIAEINQLEPDILCILFDDMRGDIADLAQIQIDIAHQAAEHSSAKKIIFCPTYYSFDPVLEKVFGTMPTGYWETFARKLDPKIDVFWTGEKVCSTEYSNSHLAQVSELLGRNPFLWDNYPVNDGAVKSNLLQLRAFGKGHSQLDGKVAGHAANPMNQAWLSQIPLASLPMAYQQTHNYSPQEALTEVCANLCGPALAEQLCADISALQDRGLKHFTQAERTQLRDRYLRFSPNPFALELVEWLDGAYTFDPACLTE